VKFISAPFYEDLRFAPMPDYTHVSSTTVGKWADASFINYFILLDRKIFYRIDVIKIILLN
jgi:hypothetical protein